MGTLNNKSGNQIRIILDNKAGKGLGRQRNKPDESLQQLRTAMHHHTENESSLFSCLVLSSFVFSSLVLSLLFRLPFSLCPCLLSLSSSSVSVCLCLRVLLRVVLWCVVVCGVWCGTLEKPRVSTQHVSMCAFKTSPFVPAPRAHMLKHVCALCRYKRRRFERTHGDVFHR